MKKIFILIGALLLCAVLKASSCLDNDTTGGEETNKDSEEIIDNKTDGNKTEDDNKTEDNKTVDNTKIEDNKPVDNTVFSDAEIAAANTAAGIQSMSQMEKDIVLYCNLARLDGAKFWKAYGKKNANGSDAYVSSLESDLKSIKDLPMFVPEKSLMEAAAYHASDMSKNNFFEHASFDGTSFSSRVRSYYGGNAIAENISAGMNSAIGVVMQLLVDDGLSGLGHRKNILGSKYTAIGVKTATHKTWRTVTVQDFGDKVFDKML